MRPVATVAEKLRTRGLLDIARAIADEHFVTLDELLGEGRTKHFVRARHAFWAALRARRISDVGISHLTGFDHTTVRSALVNVPRPDEDAPVPAPVAAPVAASPSAAPSPPDGLPRW